MSTHKHERTLDRDEDGKIGKWETDKKNPGADATWNNDIGIGVANQAEGYEIPNDERHLFHVAMLKRVNNASAKRYDEQWTYQTFTPTDWKNMQDDGSGNSFLQMQGYEKVDILHDPTLEAKAKKDGQGSKAHTPPINPGSQVAPVNPNIPATGQDQNADVEDNDNAQSKVYVSLSAARNKYKKLYGIDADENATIDELNELIANAVTGTSGGQE